MSFTDQQPRIATEEDCGRAWGGGKNGKYFRCGFCGHTFHPGDYWRWVYTNDTPGASGNPATCQACDTKDRVSMIEKWRSLHAEVEAFQKRHWWFFKEESAP